MKYFRSVGLSIALIWLGAALLPTSTAQVPITINSGTVVPGNCQVGGLYVKTGAVPQLYYCSATDTWTAAGSLSPTLTTPDLGVATATSLTTLALQVSAVNAVAPGETACDVPGETGKVWLDSTADVLYLCSGASGWRTVSTSAP